MNAYLRVSAWLAYLASAVLVVWGIEVLALNLAGISSPFYTARLMVYLILSFLLYELGIFNIGLLARRMDRTKTGRMFQLLWLLPAALMLLFVAASAVFRSAGDDLFLSAAVLYFLYACALAAGGLRLVRAPGILHLRRTGQALMAAGTAFAVHAVMAVLSLATGLGGLVEAGFWTMLSGGAAIALAQLFLGRTLSSRNEEQAVGSA